MSTILRSTKPSKIAFAKIRMIFKLGDLTQTIYIKRRNLLPGCNIREGASMKGLVFMCILLIIRLL